MDAAWVFDKIIPVLVAALLASPLSALFTFYLVKNRLERKFEQEKTAWQLKATYKFNQTQTFRIEASKILAPLLRALEIPVPLPLYINFVFLNMDAAIIDNSWKRVQSETIEPTINLQSLATFEVERAFLLANYAACEHLKLLTSHIFPSPLDTEQKRELLEYLRHWLHRYAFFLAEDSNRTHMEDAMDIIDDAQATYGFLKLVTPSQMKEFTESVKLPERYKDDKSIAEVSLEFTALRSFLTANSTQPLSDS